MGCLVFIDLVLHSLLLPVLLIPTGQRTGAFSYNVLAIAMPRKARVNRNYHYMGPHPPPFAYGAPPNTPLPKPLLTHTETELVPLPSREFTPYYVFSAQF